MALSKLFDNEQGGLFAWYVVVTSFILVLACMYSHEGRGVTSTPSVAVVVPVFCQEIYQCDSGECSQRSTTSIVPVIPVGRYQCDTLVDLWLCFLM